MAANIQGTDGNPIWGDATAKAIRAQLFDANGNPLSALTRANAPALPGLVPIGGVADQGHWRGARVDKAGNLRAGFDMPVFRDPIEGTTVNTSAWAAATTTWTQAQTASSGISLNSGAGLAANSYSTLTSLKQFEKRPGQPLKFKTRMRVQWYSNTVVEMGISTASTNTAQVPNGAYWRYTSGGTVIPVLSFNSSDVQQGTDISASLNGSNYYWWEVFVEDGFATFNCTDASTGRVVSEQVLYVPITQAKMFGASHVPALIRGYVTATAAPSAPVILVGETGVTAYDVTGNKPWPHIMASLGLGAEASPTAFSQAATFANSAAPANATLSNTAAGYSTLGGLFSFAAVAGAATDYALFSYQVPAPYSFICTGAHITAYNTGAAVATSPTLMQWGLVPNASAVSLATAGISRVPLGSQYFAVGAAIGQCADKDLEHSFETPFRTDSNRYLTVILRMPVGTATASQVVQGAVQLRGYFE